MNRNFYTSTRSKEKRKTPPLIYYTKQRGNIGKKPLFDDFEGRGVTPPKYEKYKILRGNTPKLRTYVIVTDFFLK